MNNIGKQFNIDFPNQVSSNYYSLIRKSKPISTHELKSARGLSPKYINRFIPSLNTDIRFSLPRYSIKRHPALAAITSVPESFSWLTVNASDTPDIINIKNMITKPPNQGQCGSCWAVSTANCISDNFLVSKIIDYNPILSSTWSLSCYPQTECTYSDSCGGQCNGGNPSELLIDISKTGISSDHCVDYSWCEGNSLCIKKNVESLNLNTLIPNCGCYNTNVDHYLYKIDSDINVISSTSTSDLPSNSLIVKKHILSNGPVITGFFVLSNFVDGMFATNKNTKGIYLENYDYDNDAFYDDNTINSLQLLGAHAVVVIGWGIEKQVVIDSDGTKKDVPYWMVRNSWSTNWGDKGCFKMAMYPINMFSQFDVQVNGLGGTILFNVSQKPVKATFKQIEDSYKTKLSQSEAFYAVDPISGLQLTGPISFVGYPIIGKIIMLTILILIGIWVYKYYKQNNL